MNPMAEKKQEEGKKQEAGKKKTAASKKQPAAKKETAPKKTAASAGSKKTGTASTKKTAAEQTKKPAEARTGAKPEKTVSRERTSRKGKKTGVKYLRVTQTASSINRQAYQRKTLIGLGLNKINRTRELEDTPAVRGMINSIPHLVKVEEVA